MNFSRRKFIVTSGTLAAGSGLFILGSCGSSKPDFQQLNFDYAGPHEYFRDFRDLCKGLRATDVVENDFEQSVSSSSRLVFLAEPLGNRAIKLLMLLEQGKDVLVLPPLATGYDEFNAIQLQCNTVDRRLALVNPYRYFPSFREFRRLISDGSVGRIGSIEISIDPGYNISYLPPVESIAGTALLLITTINEILASFPVSVMAQLSGEPGTDDSLKLEALLFEYQDIIMNCRFLPGTGGWNITAAGDKDRLVLKENGELLSGSDNTLIRAGRKDLHDSLRYSIEDFVAAIRESREPESNSVEGLMQITINLAIERAITEGGKINLVEQPYYYETDKVWMQENRI